VALVPSLPGRPGHIRRPQEWSVARRARPGEPAGLRLQADVKNVRHGYR